MNITNSSFEVMTHDFRLNGEWDIYRTKAEWKVNVLSFPTLTVRLKGGTWSHL